MKLAYVTSAFPYGEQTDGYDAEIDNVAELGHELLVIPARTGKRLPESRAALQVLTVNALHPATCLAAGKELALARAVGLRAVFSNLPLSVKALAIAREVRAREIDHIHAQTLDAPATIAFIVSQVTGIPWSCTAHGWEITDGEWFRKKVESARFLRVISPRVRLAVLKRAGTRVAERCRVLHPGISVPQRAYVPKGNRVVRIVCPVDTADLPRHTDLLAAVDILRKRGVPFECDITVAPERAQAPQALLRSFNGRVRVRTGISASRLLADLGNGRYDVVVFAGAEHQARIDGLPQYLLEAMGMGVVCVAPATGSAPELIEDGVSARLIPRRDSTALADALAELAAQPHLRAAMGLQARLSVLARFDSRRSASELCSLILSYRKTSSERAPA